MRKHLTFICLFLAVVCLQAQSFEGKIIYQNHIQSKTQKITDLQWTTMMGNSTEYFIKKGMYKSVTDGNFFQWQLYTPKQNKVYAKYANSSKAFWSDAALNRDTILKIERKVAAVEILGYSCDELVLTCTSGLQMYYFTSEVAIDPALFVNHKYGNWYELISEAKALPLKSIIHTDEFIWESTAREVIPMKLKSKFFKLPKGMETEKSPY